MYVEKRTKSQIFTPPVYLTPPMKGLPLEFGIGVRCPECFYDGAIRWSKSFQIRLVVLIQYRLWRTASHPASHVAVAITLYAKASSLKNCEDMSIHVDTVTALDGQMDRIGKNNITHNKNDLSQSKNGWTGDHKWWGRLNPGCQILWPVTSS